MIWILGSLIVLAIGLKAFERYYCWRCKKFSARPVWSDPVFLPLPQAVPDYPDMVVAVSYLVTTCSCCARARLLTRNISLRRASN